jgi:glyoxylase-like metal-dependent hydrolase (beta-lactamase superfamily II)
MPLPIAQAWYDVEPLEGGIVWIDERYVDPLATGNIWLVRGRERDLLVDSGTGIGRLRELVDTLSAKPVVAVATVGYYDHAGGLHQFEETAIHRLDADRVRHPTPHNTVSGKYLTAAALRALPRAGYAIEEYRMPPLEPTRLLEDGDLVDLGDRRFRVLHLPGITAGSIGLYEASSQSLFLGDTLFDREPIYDGEPAGESPDADRAAFRRSLERIHSLEIATVYPGHLSPFTGSRMRHIIAAHLSSHSAD